ncbi:uncharacterized protein EDB91DRAFT_698020 [Suillus paluster]|uniref:uncharacterized protein n=1 Tax=Suillus paluster TaxID=48578 RepID=UPI001B87053D|nr:uncharacterized protein EDB91DRAFT_698020 [Suillus paluster]KAG1750601.1 hypothetical protein EDB91DRAFT_698020 [Suillus paluster]
MPDITIINDFNEDIHVAFFIGVPTNWKNHLKPGERWTVHLASLPLHFEARRVQCNDFDAGTVLRSCEFSCDDSREMLRTIGVACAAGTASVVSVGYAFRAGQIHRAPAIAGTSIAPLSLMAAACAGGAKYNTWCADMRLCTARVWVPFRNKEYSVRMVEGRGCVLWDVNDHKPV